MDEYIKKAEVFEYLSTLRNWVLKNPLSTLDTMFVVMEMFDFVDHKVESADVAHVRHGRWIEKDKYTFGVMYECSICDDLILDSGHPWNYCPNCGAKMDLEG